MGGSLNAARMKTWMAIALTPHCPPSWVYTFKHGKIPSNLILEGETQWIRKNLIAGDF